MGFFLGGGGKCRFYFYGRGDFSEHDSMDSEGKVKLRTCFSNKPHPSITKPLACNMPQAKTEVALQFSESCSAAEFALQLSLLCSVESVDVIITRSCAATSEKTAFRH